VLYGSGCSTTHNPANLPTLVAGGRNLGLRHGQYWKAQDGLMSSLYLSILRSMGIEQDSFGESDKTLTCPIFTV
jgi:hypothetical protein